MRALFHRPGALLGLLACLAGLAILVIDWLLVLDQPGERIRESIVSDIGGAALLITGAAILALLWIQQSDAGRFQRNGIETEGVIEDIRLGFFGTEVTVRFEDQTGAPQTVRLRGSNLALRPGIAAGTRVALRYDPQNPARLRFQDTLDSLAPRH